MPEATATLTPGQDVPDDFMREMHTRFRQSHDAEQEEARKAIDDIRFVSLPGEQWTEKQRNQRRGKPCYEFPRLMQAVRQVVGDQRQNRPSIKVRAVDSDTDPLAAECMQGLIRNIESTSNADVAYDTAFEYAVKGGKGVWRVVTEYADDDAFEQDVRIREIRNPFTVFFDPAAQEWDKRDGRFAFVTETIAKSEFEARYPGKQMSNFDTAGYGAREELWAFQDMVRICEYWVKKPAKRTLLKLSNGEVVEQNEQTMQALAVNPFLQVVQVREVDTHEICSYIVSGAEILSGPHPWAGKFIPIVPVWGDVVNVEGRTYWQGMVRPAKDAQRTYNFHRTMMIEQVAKAPKVPYLATAEQIKGYEKYWQAANIEDFPVLLYNPDPNAPGAVPQRAGTTDIPVAMMQLSALDADDIKATTGIYDAALGARSNETSGRAILARQKEGDTATFSYIDNLSRAIRYTGEILVDLIPKVYDTERVVRILGEDGAQKWAVLNAQTNKPVEGPDKTVYLPDITMGKYDITVSSGPSYSTQRQEVAEAMLQLSQNPAFGPLAAYAAIKNMDIPAAEETVMAMRRQLVQQGLLDPGEKDKPPPPNPMQEAQQQLQMAAAQGKVQEQQLKNAQMQQDLQIQGMQATPELQKMIADIVNAQLDAALKRKELSAPATVQ